MAVPLRKDIEQEKELTTADLAGGSNEIKPLGPKPVVSAPGQFGKSYLARKEYTPAFPEP